MEQQSRRGCCNELQDCVIVRYSEIALKLGNRRKFEDRLIANIKKQLKHKGLDYGKIYKIPGRIIVETQHADSVKAISNVFGVSSTSPAHKLGKDLDSLKDAALTLFENTKPKPKSFRITANRLEKKLDYTSPQINSIVGQHIVDKTRCPVNLENPSLEIGFELTGETAYLYTQRFEGVGGLPVGASGRVVVLLSGGIDSPVAAWLCLRRGCEVVLMHFLHESHTKTAPSKIRRIHARLKEYYPDIKLVCIPVQNIERELIMNVSAEYRIVVLRRIFLKLAEKFCRKRGYAAIASGDNIGQVASQTLANISAIKGATSLLWIRPLECFNKQEIIDISQKIGTYDFSIEEYADCCGFLLSKHPSTAADENLIKELEVLVSNAILDDAFNNSFLVE